MLHQNIPISEMSDIELVNKLLKVNIKGLKTINIYIQLRIFHIKTNIV